MKKAYQYIAFAALAFIFAACSQEDNFTPQGNQKDAPLAIASAGVAELTTRATGSNLTEGSIGVFVTSTTDNDRYKGDNIKWTYKNDGWELDDKTVVLFENNGDNQQIAAYYPYAEPDAGKVQITLPEAYSEDYENYDYLYSEDAPLSSNPADIRLNHLMAKVTVNVQATGSELGGDNAKSISLVNVPRTAAWTLPGATLSEYGNDGSIGLYHSGVSYIGYALPKENTTSLALRIETNNGRIFTATVSLDDATTTDKIEVLTSGKHYKIGVKVGKDKAEISSVSVTEWADGGTIVGGEAEEVKVETVIEGSTATITIPDVATDAMVQNAMSEFTADDLTTIIVEGPLNETRQGYIAAALTDKTVTLYLTHLAKDELSEALASADDGITVNCGYYMADASTYVAYNADGLQAWSTNVQTNPATNLSLGKDITLPLAEGETSNWTSVGSDTTPYTGTVNGNGYSITGMTIYQTTQYAGFIGYLGESGAVKNLKLKDVSVTTTMANAGGLVGYSLSVIENCAVEGGTISSSQVGGIVGYAKGKSSAPALIVACHNTAAVSGIINVGGIIGLADEYSKVIACYNSGTITHTKGWRCGGIAGVFGTGLSYLCCNYNTGTTSGETAIAGDTPSSRYHNYWSSDHDYANGSNFEGQYNKDGATKITSASEWQAAMTTMNTWLAENGYAYRYVLNTDAATKEAQPLVILEAPATE